MMRALVIFAIMAALSGCAGQHHDDGASNLWRIPQLNQQ